MIRCTPVIRAQIPCLVILHGLHPVAHILSYINASFVCISHGGDGFGLLFCWVPSCRGVPRAACALQRQRDCGLPYAMSGTPSKLHCIFEDNLLHISAGTPHTLELHYMKGHVTNTCFTNTSGAT